MNPQVQIQILSLVRWNEAADDVGHCWGIDIMWMEDLRSHLKHLERVGHFIRRINRAGFDVHEFSIHVWFHKFWLNENRSHAPAIASVSGFEYDLFGSVWIP